MKRTTHIVLGAAVAMPIAASLSPLAAAGALWLGMVGGGFPDWIDLRSDLKSHLKHRGTSHGVLLGAGLALALGAILTLVVSLTPIAWLNEATIKALVLAFALGYLSHIVADACTRAGVQPFLPLSKIRWWVLPPFMRSRSDGVLDTIALVIATVYLITEVWEYLQPWLANAAIW